MSRVLVVAALCASVSGCVAGPPKLTPEQEERYMRLPIYRPGDGPAEASYTVIEHLSAADCSAAPYGGRVAGIEGRALDNLRKKAAAIYADAVVNGNCNVAPFMNNCWAAWHCSGDAVVFGTEIPPRPKTDVRRGAPGF
jgi:hypothetical protein